MTAADLVMLNLLDLSGGGPSVCGADANHNGVADVQDLAATVSAMFNQEEE